MHSAAVSTLRSEIFDYVIIGAGFAGLSTAYFLAQHGKRGLILEKAPTIGAHASGRNAAMFRQAHDDLLIFELAQRSRQFFLDRQRQNLLDERGSLLLTHEAKGAVKLHADLASEPLSRQEVLQRFGFLSCTNFSSAIYTPHDGVVAIEKLLAYFLDGTHGHFDLRSRCEVSKMTAKGEFVELTTNQDVLRTKVVVNAAGAWAQVLGERSGSTQVSLTPFKRHLLQLAHPSWLPPQAPFFWQLDDNYYFRPAAGGLLSSLCDEVASTPGDEENSAGIEQRLLDHLGKKCSQMPGVQIEKVWACQRTFSKDRRPVVGWDPQMPWLFWVAGLGSSGVATCAALGEYAANLLTSDAPRHLARRSGMAVERFS